MGALTAWKLRSPATPASTKNTVKMLSQDGTLIEVDASKIGCGKRKKITDEQLKNWVAKK